jgi:hypothetical protein
MSIIGSNILAGASGQAAGGGYAISRSLRFNSADSAYLNRTPASAGNLKTWTWAGWVKRSKLGSTQSIFGATSDNYVSFYTLLRFTGNNSLYINDTNGGGRQTTAVYRDLSAWMHIVVALDTTQAVGADRLKLYVNNSLPAYSGADPELDANWIIGSANPHYVNAIATPGATYGQELGDHYLADIHFINGQALDPTSFGEFDDNGIWQPKAYTGTYGTNGFHLDFADNSSNTATTLGKDTSGNGNNWTPNNLSVTAGAGNDSLVDVPTNGAETDTGVGGEVRGNYATLNPLWFYAAANTGVVRNGNLEYEGPGAAWGSRYSTVGVSSGKWYFEASPTTSGPTFMVGVVTEASSEHVGNTGFAYYQNGNKYNYGSASSYGATYTTGDIIGVALDLDAGTIAFYKNGTSQGTAFTGIAANTYYPGISGYATTGVVNFGQRPFAYTAPSGFKALNTANLPAPVVTKPSDLFDVKLYTGNGSTQTISGLGFSPDLVWLKGRSVAYSHQLYDQVRGAGKLLNSNLTSAESTVTDNLTAFTSAGFSLGSDAGTNQSSASYVAWAWDAGSSTVTNTQGSISSQVRANASAGFSVVSVPGYTYPTKTAGHGLGVEPHFIITKNRGVSNPWIIYHKSAGADTYFQFDTGAGYTGVAGVWSGVTSTVFPLNSGVNQQTDIVAYCFAPVSGYSSFGSYTGNGSADGPFVYTGFRPRWVMIKRATGDADDWQIRDTSRSPYNTMQETLFANLSNAEVTLTDRNTDNLSNGFKLRGTDPENNASGATYIYAAFAEHPFQYARAR